jgi:HK97 family phage portal protein
MGFKESFLGVNRSLTANDVYEKLNPSQSAIAEEAGTSVLTSKLGVKFNLAYEQLEVVRRGVDLVVNLTSEIDFDVKDKLDFPGFATIKKKSVGMLLNYRPNEFQGVSEFRRNILMDFIIEGNAFIYYDGAYLYHLPAQNVEIIPDSKTYIKGYKYTLSAGQRNIEYRPNEIIHIKDNSLKSIFRGDSRLKSAQHSIDTMYSMLTFQQNFFDNGAVPGLVLKTKDIFSQKVKDRILRSWTQRYSPTSGGRRPLILDGGLEIDKVSTTNFKELDFEISVSGHEERILKAIGVPPVLLNAGNNANITPNLKLFYITTIIPIAKAFLNAYERFFSYDLAANLTDIIALRPELKDVAEYYTSLVNNGIMLGSEARTELRLDPLDDQVLSQIRIPANVAGSATGVAGQAGGRPPQGESNA